MRSAGETARALNDKFRVYGARVYRSQLRRCTQRAAESAYSGYEAREMEKRTEPRIEYVMNRLLRYGRGGINVKKYFEMEEQFFLR